MLSFSSPLEETFIAIDGANVGPIWKVTTILGRKNMLYNIFLDLYQMKQSE